MAQGYRMEMLLEIWNDDSGEHLEVGEDRDGLDLVEIRAYDSNNKVEARMTFTVPQAHLLLKALDKFLASRQS